MLLNLCNLDIKEYIDRKPPLLILFLVFSNILAAMYNDNIIQDVNFNKRLGLSTSLASYIFLLNRRLALASMQALEGICNFLFLGF